MADNTSGSHSAVNVFSDVQPILNKSNDDATRNTFNNTSFVPWDNPDNVISRDTYHLIERILLCYINPLMLCVGVPTNILNCVVFARQGLRDRMNLCLFSLALVDLLFVLSYFLSGSHCWLGAGRPDLQDWWKWVMRKHVIGLYQGFQLCSACLTMIISVERCVCVFVPLKAATLVKTRTMGVLIVSTVGFIHLLCLSYPLQMEVVARPDPSTNTTTYQLSPSSLYLQHPHVFEGAQFVITNVLPFTVLTVLTVVTAVTVVQLKRTIAWRESSTASSSDSVATSRQLALVKTLVIVSTIFILTSSPIVAISIASSLLHEFFLNRRYNNIFQVTYALYLALCMLNSSVNFFVYVRRSSRYREKLRALPGLALWRPDREQARASAAGTKVVQ